MHHDVLPPAQRSALLALGPLARRGFYLADGSALCVRLGHRVSIDLVLFRLEAFDAEQLLAELRTEGLPLSNARSERGTLWFDVEGVETSVMSYPYPQLESPDLDVGVPIAALADIAAMKVEAISSRGARKDFVDLYFICERAGLGLSGALVAFERRFASASPDVLHRVKALTYFDDAEREPPLLMLQPVEWHEVRGYFETQVRAWWKSR